MVGPARVQVQWFVRPVAKCGFLNESDRSSKALRTPPPRRRGSNPPAIQPSG